LWFFVFSAPPEAPNPHSIPCMSSSHPTKPFRSIPHFETQPSPASARTAHPPPFNPWALNAVLHEQLESPKIYRMTMHAADGDVESVWINDEAAAREVLQNRNGNWRKGPQTFEPFSSLVPKHLIALEGEEHQLLRASAQAALGDFIADGTISRIAQSVGARLVRMCERAAAAVGTAPTKGAAEVWFASRGTYNSHPVALCSQVDKMFRAAALEIVSQALFGKSWGSLEDYSASNKLSDALARTMHELHWRVGDFSDREWRRNSRAGAAGELLDTLDAFIEQEIDASRLSAARNASCMLDAWTRDAKLSRDQVRNLCLTFLTMGHENIASGLAWVTLCLAHDEQAQQRVRAGNRQDLETAFFEAMRLFPSVAGLTRTSDVDTTFRASPRSWWRRTFCTATRKPGAKTPRPSTRPGAPWCPRRAHPTPCRLAWAPGLALADHCPWWSSSAWWGPWCTTST
jgi:cytochrome P450